MEDQLSALLFYLQYKVNSLRGFEKLGREDNLLPSILYRKIFIDYLMHSSTMHSLGNSMINSSIRLNPFVKLIKILYLVIRYVLAYRFVNFKILPLTLLSLVHLIHSFPFWLLMRY